MKKIMVLTFLLFMLSACSKNPTESPMSTVIAYPNIDIAPPTSVMPLLPTPTHTPSPIHMPIEFEDNLNDLSLIGSGERAIAIFRENSDLPIKKLSSWPNYMEGVEYEFRWCDAGDIILSEWEEDLALRITFNEATKWPTELPELFDPKKIIDIGKNPGLGVRSLHDSGIVGNGVNIGIIDMAMNVEALEFADNIVWYEEMHNQFKTTHFHGPAVTSLAVGKNTGVAPGAKVYYIAASRDDFIPDYAIDNTYTANAIRRLLDISELLPEGEKLSAISISQGFWDGQLGYEDVMEAIAEAKAVGIAVITCSLETTHGVYITELVRGRMDDPDEVENYGVLPRMESSMTQSSSPYSLYVDKVTGLGSLGIPMASRSYIMSTDSNGWENTSIGGSSWIVPWITGMYSLCVQVNPNISFEHFLELASETASLVERTAWSGEAYVLRIINPTALIDAVSGK